MPEPTTTINTQQTSNPGRSISNNYGYDNYQRYMNSIYGVDKRENAQKADREAARAEAERKEANIRANEKQEEELKNRTLIRKYRDSLYRIVEMYEVGIRKLEGNIERNQDELKRPGILPGETSRLNREIDKDQDTLAELFENRNKKVREVNDGLPSDFRTFLYGAGKIVTYLKHSIKTTDDFDNEFSTTLTESSILTKLSEQDANLIFGSVLENIDDIISLNEAYGAKVNFGNVNRAHALEQQGLEKLDKARKQGVGFGQALTYYNDVKNTANKAESALAQQTAKKDPLSGEVATSRNTFVREADATRTIDNSIAAKEANLARMRNTEEKQNRAYNDKVDRVQDQIAALRQRKAAISQAQQAEQQQNITEGAVMANKNPDLNEPIATDIENKTVVNKDTKTAEKINECDCGSKLCSLVFDNKKVGGALKFIISGENCGLSEEEFKKANVMKDAESCQVKLKKLKALLAKKDPSYDDEVATKVLVDQLKNEFNNIIINDIAKRK